MGRLCRQGEFNPSFKRHRKGIEMSTPRFQVGDKVKYRSMIGAQVKAVITGITENIYHYKVYELRWPNGMIDQHIGVTDIHQANIYCDDGDRTFSSDLNGLERAKKIVNKLKNPV